MLKIRVLCLFSLLFTHLGVLAQESVLAQGNWYKMGVLQSGLRRRAGSAGRRAMPRRSASTT